MMDITKAAGAHLGVYRVCIPGGDNVIADTLSGFLTNMDKNVDIFAAKALPRAIVIVRRGYVCSGSS